MKSYLHCAGYADVHSNQCLFGNFFCTGRVVGKKLCVMENVLSLLIYLMGFGHSFQRSLPLNAPVIHLLQKVHLNSQG